MHKVNNLNKKRFFIFIVILDRYFLKRQITDQCLITNKTNLLISLFVIIILHIKNIMIFKFIK